MGRLSLRRGGWLLAAILLVLILLGFAFCGGGGRKKSARPTRPVKTVLLGNEYRVWVSRAEVKARSPSRIIWDRFSPPDLYYQLSWHDQPLYRSKSVKNAWLAEWPEPDGLAAPLLKIEERDSLRLRFYDADLLQDDLIGVVEVDTNDLFEGENYLHFPSNSDLKEVVLRVAAP